MPDHTSDAPDPYAGLTLAQLTALGVAMLLENGVARGDIGSRNAMPLARALIRVAWWPPSECWFTYAGELRWAPGYPPETNIFGCLKRLARRDDDGVWRPVAGPHAAAP